MSLQELYKVETNKENERLLNLYCTAYMMFADNIEEHVYRHCELNGIENMSNEELSKTLVDFLEMSPWETVDVFYENCEELVPFAWQALEQAGAKRDYENAYNIFSKHIDTNKYLSPDLYHAVQDKPNATPPVAELQKRTVELLKDVENKIDNELSNGLGYKYILNEIRKDRECGTLIPVAKKAIEENNGMTVENLNLIGNINDVILADKPTSNNINIKMVQDKTAEQPTIIMMFMDANKDFPSAINKDGNKIIGNTVMGKANLKTGYIELLGGEMIGSFPDNHPEYIGQVFAEKALEIANERNYLICLVNEMNEFANDDIKENITFVLDDNKAIITAVDINQNVLGTLNVTESVIDMGYDDISYDPDFMPDVDTKTLAYSFIKTVNDAYANDLSANAKEINQKTKDVNKKSNDVASIERD